MKRKITLVLSLVALMACIFALSVNAACTECTDHWTLTLGEDGYLGEITAVNVCSVCDTALEVETIDPLFVTLGYSYSSMGGITQHYAVNREAVARYEELSQEKVRFGAVVATRNHVSGDPLDKNGEPVSQKVKSFDFTDTEYDIFDVIVNNISEDRRESVGIICCAYIIAGGKITYIDNGVEKSSAAANTYNTVAQKVDNKELDTPSLPDMKIINGVKYMAVSVEDMGLMKWCYWLSTSTSTIYDKDNSSNSSTGRKYYATKKFTKDELPQGSIIMVESGWSYRPEGWANADSRNTGDRPDTTSNSVVVTEEWWGSFNYRAFNISPGSVIADTVTAEDIYKVFQIYIPVESNPPLDVAIPPISTPEIEDEGDIVVPEAPFDPTEDTEKQDWDADGALKILCIGNSFSVDSMEYVYQAAQAAGVKEIVLGNLFIGGCSLEKHLSNATNDSASYTYYTNTSGTWSNTSGYKISTAVQSDDWDFISFQQVSGYSGVSDSYANLEDLISIVEPLNPSARLVWHMTWAYKSNSTHGDFSKYNNDQMTMYNAIVDAVKTNIVNNEKIEIVIPAGTAIQNARTSYIGDTLTRDGYHLSYDLGRFIGSLSFVKALTGLSIDSITYAPSGVDANELKVAIESVNNAVLKPYEVTASAYETEPESGDDTTETPSGSITGYTVLTIEQMEIARASYYNSSANNSSLNTNAENNFSRGFIATKIFTKEELPVGTIIEIAEGYQYRPDGWGSNKMTRPSGVDRPDNVSTARVVVDAEWWGDFEYRAFNISLVGHTSSKNLPIDDLTDEEISAIFKISVPIFSDDGATEGGETEGGETEGGETEGGTNEDSTTDDSIVNESGLVLSENCVSEVTNIDGVEYRALTKEALGIMLDSYYFSEESMGIYLENPALSENYAATKEFDRDELVDGAVIWVASGWQYRPEGWVGTTLNTPDNRPGNVGTTYVTIDSDWWGSFTTRAFNISLQSSGDLDAKGYDTVESICDVFKIYIPVSKIAE